MLKKIACLMIFVKILSPNSKNINELANRIKILSTNSKDINELANRIKNYIGTNAVSLYRTEFPTDISKPEEEIYKHYATKILEAFESHISSLNVEQILQQGEIVFHYKCYIRQYFTIIKRDDSYFIVRNFFFYPAPNNITAIDSGTTSQRPDRTCLTLEELEKYIIRNSVGPLFEVVVHSNMHLCRINIDNDHPYMHAVEKLYDRIDEIKSVLPSNTDHTGYIIS